MGGLTKTEKETMDRCGYPNYMSFMNNFKAIFSKELGYQLEVTFEPFEVKRGKYKQLQQNHYVLIEGFENKLNGRQIWEFYKEGWGLVHAIEDMTSFWFPKTKEEFDLVEKPVDNDYF